MIEKLKSYIEKHDLFTAEHSLLVAVSGGVDSMVLLDLLRTAGYSLNIAHCNFQLRDEESDGDEQLVRAYAKTHDLPIFVKSFDTKTLVETSEDSLQMVARNIRYSWFRELCADNEFDKIVVAHHKEDQAETMLLNLVRGTGVKGLGGMRPENEDIVRPLLFASKSELKNYAKEQDLSYRNDSSNADDHYRRNFMRLNVMPLLQEINPSVVDQMSETANRVQEVNAVLDDLLKPVLEGVCTWVGEDLLISKSGLKHLSPLPFYLHRMLHPFGFNAANLADIQRSLDAESGKWFYSSTHRLLLDRKDLVVSPRNEASQDLEVTIEKGCDSISSPISLNFSQQNVENFEMIRSAKTACLDLDQITFPLTLRKYRAGDSFYPLGMKHKKLLSDFLIDSKVSRLGKEDVYLLLSGNEIVWVVGYRIDNQVRITSETKSVLRVDFV